MRHLLSLVSWAAGLVVLVGWVFFGSDDPDPWLLVGMMLFGISLALDYEVRRHEWRCPSCGAVTRARMSDHQ